MADIAGGSRLVVVLIFLALIGVSAGQVDTQIDPPPADSLSDPRLRAKERIATLQTLIAHHDDLYFKKAQPEISDVAYDSLKRELQTLTNLFPDIKDTGISLADDHAPGFTKASHRTRALSLNKAYTRQEFDAFVSKIESVLGHPTAFLIEPKIDGISVSAVYDHGRFVRALTRGNGSEGDDITANALHLRSLPRELKPTTGNRTPIPDFVELRGEIYISFADFRRLNHEREEDGEAPFTHPRNVAAATMKSSDPHETEERGLDVVFYGWGYWSPAEAAPATQQDFHRTARAWGLPTLETWDIVKAGKDAWPVIQKLGQQRRSLAAPTDGAVIKLNSVPDRLKFGESDHAPNWAIAFKYAAESATTRLNKIALQVGRSGVITPVAEFETVKLGGASVSRATLFNKAQIERLDLREGDWIVVEKAGEIIPQVVGVDVSRRAPTSRPFVFPAQCPSCGHPIEVQSENTAVHCRNPACPARARYRLLHFAGKSGVHIKGLGPATIDALIRNGQLNTWADFYRLRIRDLVATGTVGEGASSRIAAEINRSRQAATHRLFCALGLPGIGTAKARLLATHFPSLEALATANPTALPGDLGDAARNTLSAYLSNKRNRDELLELVNAMKGETVEGKLQ